MLDHMVVNSYKGKGNFQWHHTFTQHRSYVTTLRKMPRVRAFMIFTKDLVKYIVVFFLDGKIEKCLLNLNIQKVLINGLITVSE